MGKNTHAAGPLSAAWKRLYDLSDRLQELAPWEWMSEPQLFGVQFPRGGTVGFASVMGALGQHRAVTVYLGPEGLRGFWRAQGPESEDGDPTDIFHVRQLMASFEDRGCLERRDREQIRSLGLSYGAQRRWPLFRSYRPGYHPWFLEPAEVEMLGAALEQTLLVAPRVREEPSLLEAGDEEGSYLVRAPRVSAGELLWEERRERLPLEPLRVASMIDPAAVARLNGLPQSEQEIELDCLAAPIRVGPAGKRPQWPHLLVAVDSAAGLVLGTEFLEAVEGLPAMWGRIPAGLLSMLDRAGSRPARVCMRSGLYGELLRPALARLHVEVILRPELRAVEEVKQSLFKFLSR